MSSYNPLISKIHKSRNIILKILEKRGFNVDDWTGFSINEIQTLYNNKQLDILVSKDDKKIYVKYHLDTRLGYTHIYEYIDDLFDVEEILTDDDELIIISKDKINATTKSIAEDLFVKDNKFVNIYNLHDYLFNILDHTLVPEHRIINESEKKEVEKFYNIVKDSHWPEISRFDPVATAIGIKPGQVAEITRSSPTSLTTKYYRLCK